MRYIFHRLTRIIFIFFLQLFFFNCEANAAETIFTQSVSVNCTSDGQVCSPAASGSLSFTNSSFVSVRFQTSAGHCSDVSVQFSGAINGTTGFLTAGAISPVIEERHFEAGDYSYTMAATGRTGGCNVGRLASWSGTVIFHINSEFDPNINMGPPDDKCQNPQK